MGKIKKIAESFFTLAKVVHSLTSTSEADALAACCGKELNEKIIGQTVFTSETGTNGNIEFTKSTENCRYIDIDYSMLDTHFTKRIYTKGKSALDGMCEVSEVISRNFTAIYTISDTEMTFTKGFAFNRDYESGTISGNGNSNDLKIHKVIAYF